MDASNLFRSFAQLLYAALPLYFKSDHLPTSPHESEQNPYITCIAPCPQSCLSLSRVAYFACYLSRGCQHI
jgi:hypothetical protein